MNFSMCVLTFVKHVYIICTHVDDVKKIKEMGLGVTVTANCCQWAECLGKSTDVKDFSACLVEQRSCCLLFWGNL